jgi:very-short-patch-repair endonuclease
MKRSIHSLQGIPDGKFREARRLRREMTDSERKLWTRLRRNQVDGFHFRRQHVLFGFILDFYCIEVKLAVEVDGGIHINQKHQDSIRDGILASRGILVFRVTNDRVLLDMDRVVKEISELCHQRHKLEAQ